MPKRGKRGAKRPDVEFYRIVVRGADAYVSISRADRKHALWDRPAFSSLNIVGGLVMPIAADASVTVFCSEDDVQYPGSIISTKPGWQLVVTLPRNQFVDVLSMTTTGKLGRVDFLAPKPRFGKGPVNSVDFHTAATDELEEP